MRFELYSDVMLACQGLNTLEAYHALSIDGNGDPNRMRVARQLLWDTLGHHRLYTLVAVDGQFAHLGTTKELHTMMMTDSIFRRAYALDEHVRAIVDPAVRLSPPSVEGAAATVSHVVMNSRLHGPAGSVAAGAIVEHCELRGAFDIQRDAVVSGVHGWLGSGLRVASGMVVQQTPLDMVRLLAHPRLKDRVIVDGQSQSHLCVLSLFGMNDPIKNQAASPSATFCHRSWTTFATQIQASPDEWWGDLPPEQRTVWTARVFPILVASAADPMGDASLVDTPLGPPTKVRPIPLHAAHATVLWMQDPTAIVEPMLRRAWLAAPRMSLQEILACSDPGMPHVSDLFHVFSCSYFPFFICCFIGPCFVLFIVFPLCFPLMFSLPYFVCFPAAAFTWRLKLSLHVDALSLEAALRNRIDAPVITLLHRAARAAAFMAGAAEFSSDAVTSTTSAIGGRSPSLRPMSTPGGQKMDTAIGLPPTHLWSLLDHVASDAPCDVAARALYVWDISPLPSTPSGHD
jgi:hypothetical protein